MARLKLALHLVLLAAVSSLLPSCDKAPDPPEKRTIYGIAAVEKASDGSIAAVRINAHKRSRVYHIDLDEKGKQLADMAGKDLVVTGMYQRREGERWMTAMEFRERGVEPTPPDDTEAPKEKKALDEKKAPKEE